MSSTYNHIAEFGSCALNLILSEKHYIVFSSVIRLETKIHVMLTGIPEAPRKTENWTSGSVRHPIVLRIQSEDSIPILGYSVIGQILTCDPHFYNTMFLAPL